MTESGPFADVLRANREYARNFSLAGLDGNAARGLGLLTCIDTRIDPLRMLGLSPGDAKILRNAGARVTDDVLRTLMLASYLLGVERVMIVAHTNCRMTAGENEVRRSVREAGGPDVVDLPLLAAPSPEEALRVDVDRLLTSPLLPAIEVGGFVYDVDSGLIDQVI